MMFKYMLKALNNHHLWECQKKFASDFLVSKVTTLSVFALLLSNSF